MTVNVAVRNWRFLYNLGISSAQWFDGFARQVNVRKNALFGVDTDVVGPICLRSLLSLWTLQNLDCRRAPKGSWGAPNCYPLPFVDYERQVREQMTEMFAASGFDAKRDIAGIVMNRFGHAFINPQPGFFFGLDGKPAARDALRNGPFGRIAFSHSDLAGAMDHRNAFMESHRAVGQLLDRVLT